MRIRTRTLKEIAVWEIIVDPLTQRHKLSCLELPFKKHALSPKLLPCGLSPHRGRCIISCSFSLFVSSHSPLLQKNSSRYFRTVCLLYPVMDASSLTASMTCIFWRFFKLYVLPSSHTPWIKGLKDLSYILGESGCSDMVELEGGCIVTLWEKLWLLTRPPSHLFVLLDLRYPCNVL